MQAKAIDLASARVERRSHPRLRVRLYGRFMLEDRSEHPCQVSDISASGVALRAERHGDPGEKVIVYLDHVGRLEGIVARTLSDGFALAINASERKRDKLAAQLIWLANKEKFGLPEDRRHQRVTPRKSVSELVTGDGRRHPCRIIDLSLSGAAVETEIRPTLGAAVALGTMHGRIVRHFEEGVAIEFAVLQRLEALAQEFDLNPT